MVGKARPHSNLKRVDFRPIVAHQTEHLSAPHGHAHVVERGKAAVALGEAPCLYHIFHRVASLFLAFADRGENLTLTGAE